ncbi:MAG: hypothetical protein RKO24_00770 [Candidatus Competibacter sp.]|nr:hypothetical protein [Candidatus Competibacter sp.]
MPFRTRRSLQPRQPDVFVGAVKQQFKQIFQNGGFAHEADQQVTDHLRVGEQPFVAAV